MIWGLPLFLETPILYAETNLRDVSPDYANFLVNLPNPNPSSSLQLFPLPPLCPVFWCFAQNTRHLIHWAPTTNKIPILVAPITTGVFGEFGAGGTEASRGCLVDVRKPPVFCVGSIGIRREVWSPMWEMRSSRISRHLHNDCTCGGSDRMGWCVGANLPRFFVLLVANKGVF